MKDQRNIQNLLRAKLLEIQATNPRYSVRAFARRLGISAAAANEVLKGQRNISQKMANRLADKLLLDPTERTEILKAFAKKKTPTLSRLAEQRALKISADQFEVIAHWSHFAILSLLKLKSFKSQPDWIANRLGLSVDEAKEALNRLVRVGLLKRLENGSFKRSHDSLNTTDDVSSTAIRKSHMEDMELAKVSLMNDPVDLRDFTSFTIPTSKKLLPKAKESIRRFQNEMADLMEFADPDEVYRLVTYFFPLTKIEKSEKSK